jgi:hypothetical protein
MATQVYRVVRVRTATASPVARLEAINAAGHELHLELSTGLVERVVPGHVLVLSWSIHALPEPATPAIVQDPEVGAAPPAPSALSGRAVDDAFMSLMSRIPGATSVAREPFTTSTTPPASQARSESNDDLTKLLGSTRKGY